MLLCSWNETIGKWTLPVSKCECIALLCWWSLFYDSPCLSSFFLFSLLHAWVSMVSINLCNPCDQGRVDITIENMYFHAGNKLKEFISSLSCIHFYMFAKLAQINKCGILDLHVCFEFLNSLVYKTSGLWIRRHGKTEVSLINSASCSMHHALRKRCRIL